MLGVMFYIVDIMKRTEKSQPDHENVRHAICALEEVMTLACLIYSHLFHFYINFVLFSRVRRSPASYVHRYVSASW